MHSSEHRERAEELLTWLKRSGDAPYFEADHGQVLATMALAHATLATLRDPIRYPAPINQSEPQITFQGAAAAQRVECVRLATEEKNSTTSAETAFTKRDAVELAARLEIDDTDVLSQF